MEKLTKIFQSGDVLMAQDLNNISSKVNELVDNANTGGGGSDAEVLQYLKMVSSDGFHFVDSSGADVMNYTNNGLDVAKISSHFVELLNSSGISGSLKYEIISNKVYNF